jgi:hypothetical protein
LRGDPTAEKLKKAGFVRGGGVLVSGDYRSATDNLSLELAEVILSVILENSVSVPISVKDHAMAILRPLLWNLDYDMEFEVTRGQMMGSYLSFPLLCIQNFLSFEFARETFGIERCPLLINGDDILFQSLSVDFPRRWMSFVAGLGLDVEVTKTSISDDFGTLNSTLFEWSGDYLVVTPTLRFGMLRPVDFVNSLGTTFHSFVRGQTPDTLWRAARTYFSWHLCELKSVRLRPDELGFRGALAFRMSRVFGLLDGDLSIVEAPRAPQPHNVVPRHGVTMVEEGSLSPELKLLNSREMASWKFTVDFEDLRCKAALRYCLSLSQVRNLGSVSGPYPVWSGRRVLLTDVFSWRGVRRGRFFRPTDRDAKRVIIFDSVLQTQVALDDGPPPPYGEEEGGGDVMVETKHKPPKH